jgi:hypothetical protein
MTATLSDGAMLDPLDFYFVEWPGDPAALDVHECGRVICDVEHTDTLATLVRTVLAHEFSGCGPYPHRWDVDSRCCAECGTDDGDGPCISHPDYDVEREWTA